MSTYVFGDIQGCYTELSRLLEKLRYDPASDKLWFVGDLINRGPDNVRTLELIMSLPGITAVLGNHELHFIAVALGKQRLMRSDTFSDLLEHAELPKYVEYLRRLPITHMDSAQNLVMVHAGLPPQLDAVTCCNLGREVEQMLRSDEHPAYFDAMYGNEPARWREDLTGMDRLRHITNFLTRIRFCKADGELELTHKTEIAPAGFAPWFSFPRPDDMHILFGHWAALEGTADTAFATALDTGCVWGRDLTALRLEDRALISVPAETSS